MRFYAPPEPPALFSTSGYPFLPEGSEDQVRITRQQEALLADLEVDDASAVYAAPA